MKSNKMKIKHLYIVGFLLIQILISYTIYKFGFQHGKNLFQKGHEVVIAQNAISAYNEFKSVALSLEENDSNNAKCLAELYASMNLSIVEDCIHDDVCRLETEKSVRKHMPEILDGQTQIHFRSDCKDPKSIKNKADSTAKWVRWVSVA